jgi:hypothetical protein
MSKAIIIKGKSDKSDFKPAPVKPTIIVGLGGSGGDILLRIRKRFFEKYGSLSQFPIVSYVWIDTDATEKNVGAGAFADQIAFSNSEKLMTTMGDTTKVTNDLNNFPHIKRWFYPGLTKLKTMTEGAGQIRAYSRLGFFEHYGKIKNAIKEAAGVVRNLENIRTAQDRHRLEVNPEEFQVFLVFSIAGGTGSGMFLDTAFLIKDLFRGQKVTTVGFVLMPGLFNPNEDRIFANSYAALKELNHYSYEHDFEVEWPNETAHKIPGPPFNYTYLIDQVNYGGNAVEFANHDILFNMVAENIFKDFTQSDFAGYKRGVRVNLDQYLVDLFAFHHRNERGDSIIDQRFITRFSSFGLASITVPADRIEQACAYKLAADVADHWGRLSNTGFNEALLTETVMKEIMPRARMLEGNYSAQGLIEQRNDIQKALLEDVRNPGQKLSILISQAIGNTCREAQQGVHRQKGQALSQYLRASVERELGLLRRDKSDPQQWGDYARAIHFNKERHVESAREALRQEVARLINEEHQNVGYAIGLLRQTIIVLRDPNRDYIAFFDRAREQALKRREEGRKKVDHLLAEILRHEGRSNWDGRKGAIIQYDIKRFEEFATDYVRQDLLVQLYGAAKEVCERLIDYIGAAETTESGALVTEGLMGELYTLHNNLDGLKTSLENKYKQFRERSRSELSLMLYDPDDIESIYMPRYLGVGEKATQKIESIGDQILQKLKTTVMDLPKIVRQRGPEAVERQIRDLAREPFQKIKEDFDVLDMLWKKYPDEADREAKVRLIYRQAKFWLHGGKRERSYELSTERHRILVGIPQNSANPHIRSEFEELLKNRVRDQGDPTISIQHTPERSEIVFYSEVGGVPVNWADVISELRQKYLQKQGDGEELHTDSNEIKFDDLVVLDDHERAELEEAHECFLLGVIFSEIKPERDVAGRVLYRWSEQIGLVGQERTVALGIEMRALAELISKKSVRQVLLERVREHLARVYRDKDHLARFNALLGWYYQEIYAPARVEDSDGAEHIEQSNMCRAVYKNIEAVERHLRSQTNGSRPSVEAFKELSLKYFGMLDKFAPVVIEDLEKDPGRKDKAATKRALRLDVGGPKVFKKGG